MEFECCSKRIIRVNNVDCDCVSVQQDLRDQIKEHGHLGARSFPSKDFAQKYLDRYRPYAARKNQKSNGQPQEPIAARFEKMEAKMRELEEENKRLRGIVANGDSTNSHSRNDSADTTLNELKSLMPMLRTLAASGPRLDHHQSGYGGRFGHFDGYGSGFRGYRSEHERHSGYRSYDHHRERRRRYSRDRFSRSRSRDKGDNRRKKPENEEAEQ